VSLLSYYFGFDYERLLLGTDKASGEVMTVSCTHCCWVFTEHARETVTLDCIIFVLLMSS
jgi:hypothetical protein